MSAAAWKGRRALVTGASAGIGAEFARQLAAAGAHLILTARRVERLEALAAELRARHGVEVEVIPADLAAEGGPEGLFDAVEAAELQVDVLVNNAGLGNVDWFVREDLAKTRLMLRVNIEALTTLTRLFAPPMVARGFGHILLLGSVAAFAPVPLFSAYAGTKAYVKSFGEGVGHELRDTGVKVTVIHPGGTHSEFSDQAGVVLNKTAEKAMMSAEDVVRIGLDRAARGRLSVVTGALNLLMTWLFAITPRWLKLRVGESIYRGLLPKE